MFIIIAAELVVEPDITTIMYVLFVNESMKAEKELFRIWILSNWLPIRLKENAEKQVNVKLFDFPFGLLVVASACVNLLK